MVESLNEDSVNHYTHQNVYRFHHVTQNTSYMIDYLLFSSDEEEEDIYANCKKQKVSTEASMSSGTVHHLSSSTYE